MILLSHIIDTSTPTYGNRDKFIVEETSSIIKGSSANSSKWIFSTNHLGTHIDMPKHFFDEGWTLTDVQVDFWIFDKFQLIDVPCSGATLVDSNDLTAEINQGTELLLIRTGFEKFRKADKYWNNNPGLSAKFGAWLRKNRPNIKMVGFDFISLASWKYREEGKTAHRAFLNSNGNDHPICIIEDMSLINFSNQINKVVVSPVFIKNCNGAPVTVFGII